MSGAVLKGGAQRALCSGKGEELRLENEENAFWLLFCKVRALRMTFC